MLTTSTEGPCLASIGLYSLLDKFKFKDVDIFTPNPIEHHPVYSINRSQEFRFFEVENKSYQEVHRWNKHKIFGCFYNRPLWHRIGLAAYMQINHNSKSLINIRANPNIIDERALFEIKELFEEHLESFECFAKCISFWPQQIEPVDSQIRLIGSTTVHSDQLAVFYPEFLIDVVAETWISGNTFFITEKTVRPMLMQKPFLQMGAKNSLEYLHQMGFKTFCNFWTEEYDYYEGRDRYIKILELIDTLAKKSTKELDDIYASMQDILKHNYDLLINKSYKKLISRIV